MNCFKLLLASASFLLLTTLHAQVVTYENQWKKVDQLVVEKNLPASALVEVKKIYARAKKEKQEAQVIKALVYMVNLQSQTRENNQVLAIAEIEKEISFATEPSRSILKSYLATLYWNYYQQVQWRLYNRTATEKFVKEDVATWSADDFHRTIGRLFLESIEQDKILKNTKLEPWDVIIIKGNSSYLRPTLYDLLAHRALDYFENDERNIRKPSYAFEISQPEAFSPAEKFISKQFSTKDSISLQHKAMLIYQDLLKFHLHDQKPDALLAVDLQRIEFVHNNSTIEEKDSLYVNALEYLIGRYPANPEIRLARFWLGSYYYGIAERASETNDTTHKGDYLKAKAILEKVVADSSNKAGEWASSYELLYEIIKKTFSFQLEKVNLPDQPFRCLVSYKNISQIHFRLIKVTDALKKTFRDGFEESSWGKMITAAPIKSWTQQLPVVTDYVAHSVEVKIDALPIGEYFLFGSADPQFSKQGNPLSIQLFYVSNISYMHQEQDYFILHRETGLPLAQGKVQLWQKKYDRNTSSYITEKAESYQTDEHGYFRLASKKNRREYYNYQLEINYNKDRLFLNDEIQDYYSGIYNSADTMPAEQFEKETAFTYLFTDRSIYRPGQIVFFKGITISTTKQAHKKPMIGFRSVIYLRNANFKTVDSLEVTSNDYGSFSGKFNLPINTLNGNFSLEMKKNRGSVSISVEEYKRPKFFVEFEKIHKAYKVYDTVTVWGNAKAYAGNMVNGAKVVYRVVRQPRMLYDWLSWKIWPPRGPATEIAHGETVTDINGKFSVNFMALPDKSIKPAFQPAFDFVVYADVTDINGETRSQQFHVSAGYVSVVIKSDIPERMPVDSLKEISIRTENINGEFQPSQLNVTIYQLIPEQRLVRKRLWPKPDRFIMTKQEFINYFPNDEYNTESEFNTWDKGEIVYRKSDSSRVSGEWSVVSGQISTGYYAIEITTKDKDGKEVKDIRYVELFDLRSKELIHPEYLWSYQPEKNYEPGESAMIQLGSSAKNVFLVQKRNDAKEVSSAFNFLKLDGNKTSFNFPIHEDDRGNITVNNFFVNNNRFYQYNTVIKVPWTNKELSIQYATFRDKTLPGSEEKWKVKIRGYKNENVAAEMLAGMYDASLDQFKPHNWVIPAIWYEKNYLEAWTGNENFTSINSNDKWFNPQYLNNYTERVYDELIFNLYSLIYRNNGYYKIGDISKSNMKLEMVKGAPPMLRKEELEESLSGKVAGLSLSVGNKNVNYLNSGNDDVSDTISNQRETLNTIEKPKPTTQPRKKFNETAFFFPDLRTDSSGMIEFSFTVPEALTRWKLQTLAHTKDLAFGISQKETITQKELMVQPNMPRFLRQGDRIELITKIVNQSDSEMTGQVQLQLFDAVTNQPVDGWFVNSFPNQYFTVPAKQSSVVKFPVQVPFQFNSTLTWRITASTASPSSKVILFSDGEEDHIAVLSNRVLVTETMPLPMKGSGIKNFVFTKLDASANNETLQHHSLTVEYTANPAWYAVQALPYLMEFLYECAEQTWNRFYANALASDIVHSAPRIRQLFSEWKNLDTSALLSNLEKNQELKNALLEETPWVLEAKNESQQKKNIGILFDLVRMQDELNGNLAKLRSMLKDEGSFPWFRGGPSDWYITQYIATGIGHLVKLKSIPEGQMNEVMIIVRTIIPYLDKKVYDDYQRLLKSKADLSKQQTSPILIHYLYMRSFFRDQPVPPKNQKVLAYYLQQAKKFWMKLPVYEQGMTALVLSRSGDQKTAADILRSLKETSIMNEELGRYWKSNTFGRSWMWNAAPIETQALMVEVFTEIGKDNATADELRTWLIRNKQTNNWNTTKATADACYAMLLRGTDWLTNTPDVSIRLGNKILHPDKTEAGTGYFKEKIDAGSINHEMSKISVTVTIPETGNKQPASAEATAGNPASSWGAVYWQYFEDLDKVTAANTPLSIHKKLFIEKYTDRGPVLTPLETGSTLHVGDKIKVRIELRSDRDMEYVHMKDMRASALEPVNVLSGYKWQDGLGYYESTRDMSTSFFFDVIRKGTYVFEYPLFVSHNGTFSNGITTIQCMYAPEFSAHSEAVMLRVEE